MSDQAFDVHGSCIAGLGEFSGKVRACDEAHARRLMDTHPHVLWWQFDSNPTRRSDAAREGEG